MAASPEILASCDRSTRIGMASMLDPTISITASVFGFRRTLVWRSAPPDERSRS